MGVHRRGWRSLAVLLAMVVAAPAALGACRDDKDFTASFQGDPDPARNPEGLHLVSTDFRSGKEETEVTVTWQRPLDDEARRERGLVVFVLLYRHGDKRPTSMVMADIVADRSIRCGDRQLEDSAPWVFANSGPFIDCPDLPEARVEATATSATVRWPNGAVRLPSDLEWVVRVVTHPRGGEPMEEFLPTQVENPVRNWPAQRAPTRSDQMSG